MATLKQRIESHIPQTIAVGDEPAFIAWMNESQEILVHLVDKKDAEKFIQTHQVNAQGIDVDLFRMITPSKGGIQAGMYPSHAYTALADSDYNGIYSVSVNSPGAVIKDGTLYIFPDGGEITAFGVTHLTDLSASKVKGMPISFTSACIFYTAIQAYRRYMNDLSESKLNAPVSSIPNVTLTVPTLDREAFLETINLKALPGSIPDVTLTADQAGNPLVEAPILSSPDLNETGSLAPYQKINPDLSFLEATNRQGDDDIEMLNGEINRLSQELQMYSAQMSDELNRVNTQIQGYQSKVSHSLEQGRLTMSANDTQANLKLNQELSNAQNNLNAAIETQRMKLQNFSEQVQGVVAENQLIISEFQSKMGKWAKESDLNVNEYQGKLQAEITRYQTEVQKVFTEYGNKVQEVAFNNQVIDQKIGLYFQQISLLKSQFDEAVTSYIRSVQDERYIPAPIDPEVPA